MANVVRVIFNFESLQYDGTNGAYICETFLAGVPLVSDNGQVLIWATPEYNNGCNLNEYVIRTGEDDIWGRSVTPERYAAEFYEVPNL